MTETRRRLEKLGKWRALFAGWQLGTRLATDPESQAVRDVNERLLLLRVEVSALTALLIEKRVCTAEEFDIQLGDEAAALDAALERRFPGVTATEEGLSFDASRADEIRSWMGHWKP